MKKILLTITSLFILAMTFGIIDTVNGYTVQRGDTLSKIATQNHVSLKSLLAVNPQVKNPSLIYPGQQLNVIGKLPGFVGSSQNVQPVAGFNYYLAGAGVNSSNSSITLQSLTIPQTGYLVQPGDLSAIFYITLEPGNSKKQEIASCTTEVQNGNGTATLGNCSRGLLPFSPFTASSTYAFSHAGGTTVIFSDAPQLFNQYAAKDNNETITGLWTFSTSLPLIPTSTPTDPRQAISLYQFNQATTTGGIYGSELVRGVWQGASRAQMAAGTNVGSTGAFLTLQSQYASSTSPTATTTIVITKATGKIDASFGGATSSLATLDSNGLVIQNPASATTSPTPGGIVEYNNMGGLTLATTTFTVTPSFPATTPSTSTTSTAAATVGYVNNLNQVATGIFTKDLTDADQATTTISTGLGRPPSTIVFSAVSVTGGYLTRGTYNVATASTTCWTQNSNANNGTAIDCSTGGYALGGHEVLEMTNGSGNHGQGAVPSLVGNNVILTWTKASTPGGNLYVEWEAY